MTEIDYQRLSAEELKLLIESATKTLKDKQESQRIQVWEQIKALAASVDLDVRIVETDNKHEKQSRGRRKGEKVPVKYRHPNDPDKSWTGRGVTPKWVLELEQAGYRRDDFSV